MFSEQISGMKMLLHREFGYNALPRRPLLPMTYEQAKQLYADTRMQSLLDLEKTL